MIVSKSTVPVGTSKRIENILRKKNSQKTYDVVSNPEFLREGSALEDFTRPDKIIIGCRSEKAEKMLKRIYKPLNRPYVVTNNSTEDIQNIPIWISKWLKKKYINIESQKSFKFGEGTA